MKSSISWSAVQYVYHGDTFLNPAISALAWR